MTTTAEHSSTTDPRAAAIIRELKACRRLAVAERISYLLSLDHDTPDEEPIGLESLHSFAKWLRRNHQLPDPRVGVQTEGLIQIEWFLNPDGILAMTFLSDGLIRVYAAFDEPNDDTSCAPINDTLTATETDAAIPPYTRGLASR